MCGIAGVLAYDGPGPSVFELRAMSASLAHRGPDDDGLLVDGRVGLAHRRLAILDPTPSGHQPMANEDGTVVVVYNGQLFGFQPLREWLISKGYRFRSRTDTEVLVHLYEERGDAMLEAIDGMFAFALWDSRRQRLLLARDRLGIKPLFFVEAAGRLAFASELNALTALPWVPKEVSDLSLIQYLYQSSVPGDRAIYGEHRKLRPGELLVATPEGSSARRYWSPPEEAPDPGGLDEAARELASRLDRAAETHLVADVPVGCFLSGGLDSTAVAKAARRRTSGVLHSFSVRFRGPAAFDEGGVARQTAAALGTEHHELELGPELVERLPAFLARFDEPFAVASMLALHELARFSREWVKVVLTGDGADETLAGYPWRHGSEWGDGARLGALLRGLGMVAVRSWRGRFGGPGLASQVLARLGRFGHPEERYAEIVSAFTPEEMAMLLVEDLRPAAARAWDEYAVRRSFSACGDPDPVNRRLRVDLETTLVDEMLTKVDRATMAAGLEARVPFLDRSLVEWSLSLPGRYKLKGGVGKRVLRHALRDELPTVAGLPKHGFDVPLGEWLRGALRPMLCDLLSPARVRRRGLMRAETVERLVHAHLSGRANLSRKLFTLMVLELWSDSRAASGETAAVGSA